MSARVQALVDKCGSIEELERRLEAAERIGTDTLQSREPSAAISNKRSQDNVSEPRKRVQVAPSTDARAPGSTRASSFASGISAERSAASDMQDFRRVVIAQSHSLANISSPNDGYGIDIEGPRLELLNEACAESDRVYLCLHQIYCIDHNPGRAASNPIDLSDIRRQGMLALSQLLVPNTRLAPRAVTWFSQFPLPMDGLKRNLLFQSAHFTALNCLEKLGQNWDMMRHLCATRKYPPVADELRLFFGIDSLILQRTIFLAILREIWDRQQDLCFQSVQKVFEKNFEEVRLRLINDANLPVERVQAYNQSIIIQYERILKRHRQGQHVQPSVPNSLLPSHQSHPQIWPARDYDRQPHNQGPLTINTHAAQQTFSGNANRPRLLPSQERSQATPTARAALMSQPADTQVPNGNLTPQSVSFGQSPMSLHNNLVSATFTNPANLEGSGQRGQSSSSSGASQLVPSNSHGTIRPSMRTPHVLPSNAPSNGRSGHQYSLRTPFEALPPYASTRSSMSRGDASPGFHPLQQAGPHRTSLPNGSQLYQGLASALPFINYEPSSLPAQLDYTYSGLHQSHVRSPILSAVEGHRNGSHHSKYFRFTEYVIMPHDALSSRHKHLKWDFNIDQDFINHLAQDVSDSYGLTARRVFGSDSRLCRVRCIKQVGHMGSPSQNEWVVSDNIWPANAAIILNGMSLEIRRKAHHGKDLPIDITRIIRAGKNELVMAVIGTQKKDIDSRYRIGVELIRVADERQIRTSIPTLPWPDAQKQILDRTRQLDPDIQVVDGPMIIDMTDPFTARLFEVPVRGSNCRHDQCFDRDTFLETRGGKNPSQPCSPEELICPICGFDARPASLVIDGFMGLVREELRRRGRADVKRIILKDDGSWQVKEEEAPKEEQGDGTGCRPNAAKAPIPEQPSPAEVIEIDDD
ncbi:hypothetical protein MMC21_000731 [Puttea exsequens]|nr:hypothetical protein [Puttea exsequens]